MFKFTPDKPGWHREGRGLWMRDDGTARVERIGQRWVPSVAVADGWKPTGFVYLTVHAAESCADRALGKLSRS